MRKIIILFLGILMQLSAVTAGNNAGSVYISGTIKQYKSKEIVFYYIKDYVYYHKKYIKTLLTDKHGNFDLTFDWDIPWQVQMIIGDNELTLFLCPGDSLLIKASYMNLEQSVKYSGNAGDSHNALKKFTKKFMGINQKFTESFDKYDSLAFTIQNEKNHNEQLDSIKKDSAEIPNRNFYEYLRAYANYNYYNNIFFYCNIKKHFFDSTYLVSLLPKHIVNNEYAISLPVYLNFIEKYIAWRTDATRSIYDKRNYWEFKYRTIKRSLNGKVRDIMLARTVRKAFIFTNHAVAMSLYYDYKNVHYDNDYLQQINNEFIH